MDRVTGFSSDPRAFIALEGMLSKSGSVDRKTGFFAFQELAKACFMKLCEGSLSKRVIRDNENRRSRQ